MGDLRNDIEKYLRGELTPAERHALEKRALADPFLADALEGGESISVEDFSADMKALHQRLNSRVGNRDQKVFPLWGWPMRIAAGLLVVAAATFVVVQISNEDSNAELAQAKPETKEAGPKPAPSENQVTADSVKPIEQEAQPAVPIDRETAKPKRRKSDPALAQAAQSESAGEVSESPIVEKETVVLSAAPQQAPTVVLSDDVVLDSIRIVAADVSRDADSADKLLQGRIAGITTLSQNGFIQKQKVSDNAQHNYSIPPEQQAKSALVPTTKVIRGKVTASEDGTVLPGVNVAIKGTEIGTITDVEGNFELVIDPSVSGLVFTFIGMESQEVTIEDATEVNVALNPDMTQLSEVVVTGYGLEPEDDIQGRVTFASPSGGRAAFKKYIESNLQYPAQALANQVEGKVTIQFTVDTSGGIGDMRVVKGIGYGCDEEVIRLITKGPKWNPMRKDDEPIVGRVKVRVRFKLPKK